MALVSENANGLGYQETSDNLENSISQKEGNGADILVYRSEFQCDGVSR
jgi:hypothetical protein